MRGYWPSRLVPGLLASVAGGAGVGVSLARHYPGDPLAGLMAGVMLGLATVVLILAWVLLAVSVRQVAARAGIALLVAAPLLAWLGGGR
ncbi:hypothetical protein [Pseudomonas putida]